LNFDIFSKDLLDTFILGFCADIPAPATGHEIH